MLQLESNFSVCHKTNKISTQLILFFSLKSQTQKQRASCCNQCLEQNVLHWMLHQLWTSELFTDNIRNRIMLDVINLKTQTCFASNISQPSLLDITFLNLLVPAGHSFYLKQCNSLKEFFIMKTSTLSYIQTTLR